MPQEAKISDPYGTSPEAVRITSAQVLSSLPALGTLAKPLASTIDRLSNAVSPLVMGLVSEMVSRGRAVPSSAALRGIHRLLAGQLARRTRGASLSELDLLKEMRYLSREAADRISPTRTIYGMSKTSEPGNIYLAEPGVVADLLRGLGRSRKAARVGLIDPSERAAIHGLPKITKGTTGVTNPYGYLADITPLSMPGLTTLHELGHKALPNIPGPLRETLADYFALFRLGMSPETDRQMLDQVMQLTSREDVLRALRGK